MRLGIYGGSFNPPHAGHIKAAAAAIEQLRLDTLLIVPAGVPPHKELPAGTPSNEHRMQLTRLSFATLQKARVTDIEIKREGVSYTTETLDRVAAEYPGADIYLIIGSDMFLTLESWKEADRLLKHATPAVFSRGAQEDAEIAAYSARLFNSHHVKTALIKHHAIAISSSELRRMLPERGGTAYLDEAAYAYIIQNRLYGAKPDFPWLRARTYAMMKPKRIPHVQGCEAEAVKLADRWGAPEDDAREAGILHDLTKHLELDDQLQLCQKYDIMTDTVERAEVKLLHAKTGAALARDLFGVSEAVHDAILWHTTGRADMTLLEKIIYIADYIEPTRDFAGLDELRSLSYKDLDLAIIKGLKMSVEDMRARGITPHRRTEEAVDWLITHTPYYKGE